MRTQANHGDPLGHIDPLLVDLLDEGISSITALRLLIFVRHPRRFAEIRNKEERKRNGVKAKKTFHLHTSSQMQRFCTIAALAV